MTKLAELIGVIEAIAVDVESTANLPAHNGELYAKPAAITPELCPLFVVFTERFPWTLLATPSYYVVRPEVRVGWYVSAAEQSEAGSGMGDVARQAAEVADTIAARLVAYSEGVPGSVGTYAKIVETLIERGEGMVLGVVHRLEVER